MGAPFQGRCPASQVNDGPCPEKPDHLIRRFLLRGLEKVNGEWALIAATHNLLKLFRFRRSQQQMLMEA
ncbi:transposase, partial [Synechococcus sp. ATX 2A4]|uniref:transposase n=1 Tax=Synechococcus sp. ATX 2A4 TaxID=2823727 RepID=UPI0037D9AC5F|nr:transposase [Synechococcus sp. ATX 2A4]